MCICISYVRVDILSDDYFVLSQITMHAFDRQNAFDRQTNRQTDRQTDRQTEMPSRGGVIETKDTA